MSPFLGPNLRLRLIGVSLLAATFIAGGIAGFATWDAVSGEVPPAASGRDPDRPCPPKPDPYAELGLTAEQRSEIDAIVATGKASIDAFWDEHGNELGAIRDTIRQRIDAVFTADQRAEMDRRREERRHRHRDCERKGGGRGAKGRRTG